MSATASTRSVALPAWLKRILGSGEIGLIAIILLLGLILTMYGGSHTDFNTGKTVSNFLNPSSLLDIATDASFFAIMAVGMTAVIVTAGIDLSIGSIYAICGISMAVVFQGMNAAHMTSPVMLVIVGLVTSLGVGTLCGLLNGLATRLLDVHPFIITLGTLWIFRGIALVVSKAQSIPIADPVVNAVKSGLGLSGGLHPIPLITMVLVGIGGSIYLLRTPMGRRIFAVGGNIEASRYAGLPVTPIIVGVYVLTGLVAGLAAFVGASYYGAASAADADGYELYVIASAVVGGASLTGGKGSALGAVLGAILIVMFRHSISILHLDTNYEKIIIGAAIVVAVVLDRTGAKIRANRLAKARADAQNLPG
jgi:ribose transport system permease protein